MKDAVLKPFNEWMPDQDDFENPGSFRVKNAWPLQKDYKSFPSLSIYSDALAAACRGAQGFKTSDDNSHMFAGTAVGLYKLQTDTSWEDVTRTTGGAYGTNAENRWKFIKWAETVIATNYDDVMQKFEIGVDTDFSALSGTPPQARHITTVGQFVVVGNTYDGTDGAVSFRVRWCGIGDPTSWTVSATTQADYQDLDATFGPVQGLVGGDIGIIFQEKAIHRMSYVGSPTVFQIDNVEPNRGAYVPGGIVQAGTMVYFISEDGFYVFNQAQSTPIGDGKIDDFFFKDLNDDYKHNIYSMADARSKLVLWAYPSNDSPSGVCDRMIVYNWGSQRWGYIELSTEILGIGLSLGWTLEDLDTITTDIDALSVSLDSPAWKGGAKAIIAFDSSHRMCFFTGDALSAEFISEEFVLDPVGRAEITEIRVLGDATVTLNVGVRDAANGTVVYGDEISPEDDGLYPMRHEGRMMRLRARTSGSFDHLQGVAIMNWAKTGGR